MNNLKEQSLLARQISACRSKIRGAKDRLSIYKQLKEKIKLKELQKEMNSFKETNTNE